MKLLYCFLSLLLFAGTVKADLTKEEKNLFNAIYVEPQDKAIDALSEYMNKGGDLLLINDDPDLNRESTLLLEAIRQGKTDVFGKFLYPAIFLHKSLSEDQKKKYVNYVGKEVLNALTMAIRYGRTKIADELVKSKLVDVNQKNKHNQTAIFDAIIYQNKDIIEALLDRTDLDLDIVDTDNENVLYYAIGNSIDFDIIKKILKKMKPESLNNKNRQGETVLMKAIRLKKDDLIKLLLAQNSLDVNAQDAEGNTALHYAVTTNELNAVEALLAHKNIDVNIKNKKGHAPIHNAIKPAFFEEDKTAKQIYESLKNSLKHDQSNNKNIEDIINNKIDIKNIKDINASYFEDVPILFWAILLRNEAMVKDILARQDLKINEIYSSKFSFLLLTIGYYFTNKDNSLIPIIKLLLNDPRTDLNIEIDNNGNKKRVIDIIKSELDDLKSKGKDKDLKPLFDLLEPVIQKTFDRPIDEFKNALASIK